MKSFVPRSIIAAAAAFTLSLSASAVTLNPVSPINPLTTLTPANGYLFSQGGNVGADDIETLLGLAVQLTEQYKQNAGGAEEKAFLGSYSTTFAPTTNEAKGSTITYDGSPDPIITGGLIYVLAKGGGDHYLWNITGWDGVDAIVMSGLYPNQGAISHVSIFSSPGGNNTTVPDGGSTVALLGLGLASLAVLRRKLN